MANTTVTANLELIAFRNDFFREYVRNNRLSPYSGTSVTSPIVIKEGRGPTIRHPLLTRLAGSGVSGADTLRGNGEAIGNYSWDTNPTYYRHAVEFTKEDLEKTNIDLMRAARPLLMEWAMSTCRDRQLQALAAVYDGTTYANLGDAAEAVRDTYLTNNTDRIIFGDSAGSGTDFSADLGQIDTTNDRFNRTRLDDMRRLAEDADPHIRPFQTDEQGEVYVCFAGSQTFQDLKTNIETINSNADLRGMKISSNGNILARDGDLFWNGCIVRKVPEITQMFSATGKTLATVGASSIAVEPVFLCGAQAAVWGLGQRPQLIVDRSWDFNFAPAVAVELKEDVKKAFFNDKQHGMVSGFFAGD